MVLFDFNSRKGYSSPKTPRQGRHLVANMRYSNTLPVQMSNSYSHVLWGKLTEMLCILNAHVIGSFDLFYSKSLYLIWKWDHISIYIIIDGLVATFTESLSLLFKCDWKVWALVLQEMSLSHFHFGFPEILCLLNCAQTTSSLPKFHKRKVWPLSQHHKLTKQNVWVSYKPFLFSFTTSGSHCNSLLHFGQVPLCL